MTIEDLNAHDITLFKMSKRKSRRQSSTKRICYREQDNDGKKIELSKIIGPEALV